MLPGLLETMVLSIFRLFPNLFNAILLKLSPSIVLAVRYLMLQVWCCVPRICK